MKPFKSFLAEAQLATKASQLVLPILRKIVGDNDYVRQVKVSAKENIVTIKFPLYHASQGAYTSVGGKDTMSGSESKKSIKQAAAYGKELLNILKDQITLEDSWCDVSDSRVDCGFVSDDIA